MTPAMNDWLMCSRPRPDARVRLFCFPHAGAGASVYRRWPAGLPADVELWAIQAPGREIKDMPAWGGVLDDNTLYKIGAYLETLGLEGANWKEGVHN